MKLVIGVFMVPDEDAEDLSKNLEEWFQGNDIGMDWHDIKVLNSFDLNQFEWDAPDDINQS